VDAGGFGLQIMLEGFLKSFEQGEVDAAQTKSIAPPAAQKSLALPEEGWGYCTEFVLEGEGLVVDSIRERISAMGNSVLVVGESELVKVHVHTEDPSKVLSYASSLGSLTRTKVDDMSEQHRLILDESSHDGALAPAPASAPEPAERRANGVGLVAVAAGEGLIDIFRGLGVDAVVEGGQTMNPSTQDMLHAVEEAPYDEVILLPNNGNVILAARAVAKLTGKKLHVLETRSFPAGIAAVVAFNGDRPADENLHAMGEATGHVQTIEVTHAVRDTKSNGLRVKKGDVIALINDKLRHAGRDYGNVVKDAITAIDPASYELVTVYRGEGATDLEADRLIDSIRDGFPDLEVEVQSGGQQHYPFILSVE
jgi:DAK2 domain fusion protein YloV